MTGLVFIANRASAKPRRETLGGTEFLVVPVVALVAGVVNGELVESAEIRPQDWNGVPVPLGHPQANGEYISDRSPELEVQSPARFYGARLENNSLKGEIWINLAQAQAIGGDAAEAVRRFEAGEVVNVSTAYFRDVTPASGTVGGKQYGGIATNLRPDHLAILLHENGACSIADGCGAPRINGLRTNQMDVSDSVIIAFYPSAADAQALALSAEGLPEGSEVTPPSQLHVTLCHLGKIEEITQGEDTALRALADFASHMPIVRAEVGGLGRFNNADPSALFAIIDSTYLQDWRRSLVYWVEDYFNISRNFGYTPHMTLAYVPNASPVTLDVTERREIVFDSVALSWGNKTAVFRLQGEVREVAEYEMTGNTKKRTGWDFLARIAEKIGLKVNKPKEMEVITTVSKKCELIAALVANARCKLSEETLKKLEENELQTLSDSLAEAPPAATPAPAADAPATPPPAAAPTQPDMSAWMNKIEGTIAGLTGQVKANADQEREQLIAALAANSQSLFTEAEYKEMKTEMLRKLAAQFTPVDYSFRGLSLATNAGGEWGEYKRPEAETSQNGGAK